MDTQVHEVHRTQKTHDQKRALPQCIITKLSKAPYKQLEAMQERGVMLLLRELYYTNRFFHPLIHPYRPEGKWNDLFQILAKKERIISQGYFAQQIYFSKMKVKFRL